MDQESSSSARLTTTRHSVLIEPGATAPVAPVCLAAYTLRGSTANFDVSYDTSLGANGQGLADAILARCASDLAKLESFFSVGSPGRFTVFIDPGTFGAFHSSCPGRDIHCAAFSGTDGNLENFLNCAEVDEVLMAAQGAGWNCAASAGEGLSRVLATELYPASLGSFATASIWLNSARPDWVTQTEGTDRDHVSIGCATLFLNYLRHQLNFALPKIVQAGGATLQQTYERLTGRSDAFGPFAALLQFHFPIGVPVNLANDNPFPLAESALVPDVLFMPELAASKAVSRVGLVPHFTGATSPPSFVNSQSPSGGKLVTRGSTVTMHLQAGATP